MADQTIMAPLAAPPARSAPMDSGRVWLFVLIAISALVVLPPFFYLMQSQLHGAAARLPDHDRHR